jgi:hypothetical protein
MAQDSSTALISRGVSATITNRPFLKNMEYTSKQNSSFIVEYPKDKDWEFLGATRLIGTDLVVNRDWRPFEPPLEVQRNEVFDPFDCVSMATNNSAETVIKRKYIIDLNNSDRYLAKASGTVPGRGNSLIKVADTFLKAGAVPEVVYPMTPKMTQAEFYQDIPLAITAMGTKWLKEDYQPNFEWVYKSFEKRNLDKQWDALKQGPLQTAVDADTNRTSEFQGYTHSVMIDFGEYQKRWHVMDSYLGRDEWYDWDYPFFLPLKWDMVKIQNINPEDMKMTLVRNSQNGKIYMVDSVNEKHWIKPTPGKDNGREVFIAYFGRKAWDEQDWTNVEPTAIDPLPEGEPITLDTNIMTDMLKKLLATFGAVFGKY